ncbi:UDP-N-acetylglucosamine 2-epimerase (non-hydrolyzing) [Flavobacteriales bacterium]|nr:UDP-N-acetylglucosamine 2-epimerase (non-hydrolyzing) [Flavobacteriales bacterium]
MKKILICVGTRPNFIKVTRFKELSLKYNLEIKLLHTGQHFDHQMSKVFFDELKLYKPDIYLEAKGPTQVEMMADIMVKFEKELNTYLPDVVLVPGDVNSSLACALVASRNDIKVGHIESGLRSFDRDMPEEINRILIDDLSDYFFVTENSGVDHLNNEGKEENKIYLVGNTMIDSLVNFKDSIEKSKILSQINCPVDYGLMTFHRPSNVDSLDTLKKLLTTIELCCSNLTMVIPLHPRTKKSLINNNLWDKFKSIKNLIFTESLGYLDFMKLVSNSKIVITDSGGVQEETTFLQIPCITVRENTERPVTITLGNNELIQLNGEFISKRMIEKLTNTEIGEIPPLWDGHATERILEILSES